MQPNTDLRRNRFAILARLGLILALSYLLAAPAAAQPQTPSGLEGFALPQAAHAGPASVLAMFTNGSFETGDFTGWTRESFINTGLTPPPPFTGADINRGVGGDTSESVVLGPFAVPDSQTDPNTDMEFITGDPPITYPRWGKYVARINSPDPSRPDLYGAAFQAHANTLKQTTTVGAGDIDPADGLVHVRFAFAPVLDKPYDHVADHQPYVYISVRNVTKSLTLFERFIFASQTDIPWKEGADDIYDGNWVYLDWQVVDVAPGAANLAVGDQIALEVTVAGCSELAHGGYVYVDAFGSESPGLSVSKTAPATAPADTDLVYTFTYHNGSGVEQTNVQVVETLPTSVTYVSDTGGCSHASGVVTCDLGTVAVDGSGSLSVTTHIQAGTPVGTKIVNGNYLIRSDQTGDILGMAVETEIVGETPTVLTGVVTDRTTGAIIPGATVKVTDSAGHEYTTTTNASGEYTFTSTVANPLAAGNATIEADSVAGYGSDSKIKTIVAGTTNTQDLSLPPLTDFGDLPAPYKTLLADNGPRHSIVSGAPYLGAVAPDAETDGQPNATATGDDSNGVDDEEGVARAAGRAGGNRWTNGTVFGGQGGAVSLTISGASACLGAFMDFNSSGTLAAVSLLNLMGNAISQPIAAGAYTFYFNVPYGTFTGSGGNPTIYGLFRVTSPVSGSCAGSTANSAAGAAPDGEVDGYAWGFTPNAVTLREFRAAPQLDLAAWLAEMLRRLGR